MTEEQLQNRLAELESGLIQMQQQQAGLEVQIRRNEGAILILRELLESFAQDEPTESLAQVQP